MINWLIAATNLIVCVTVVKLILNQLERARESSSWPSVEATILSSRTKSTGRAGIMRPAVTFTYSIEGKVYESRRVFVGWESGGESREATEKILARYPIGARVAAAFDPEKPSYCVLLPGFRSNHKTMIFVGVVFVCAFFGATIFFLFLPIAK